MQGDAEAPNLLRRLALRNPQHTFVLIGKNDGDLSTFPSNVINPWPDGISRAVWLEAGTGHCHRCLGEHDGLRLSNPDTLEAEKHVVEIAAGLDGFIVHVGQHGVTHRPIPAAETPWANVSIEEADYCGAQLDYTRTTAHRLTKPYVWARNYGNSTVQALNAMGDASDGRAPVVWLITDPRNYLKARDVKWPTGEDDVLAQYAYTRTAKHERYKDARPPLALGFGGWVRTLRNGEVWEANVTHRYGGLELMILPDDWETWGRPGFHERLPVGIASTSFGKNIGRNKRRSELIRDVMLAPYPDAEVWGTWDDLSLKDVPPGTVKVNEPTIFPQLLDRWRVTLSLPALSSSWTVAKPYQCWAGNVVTFMWGRVDDQGFVLPTRRRTKGVPQVGDGLYSVRQDWTEDELALARWARVEKPDEFAKRAATVVQDESLWTMLTTTQRALLRRRWEEHMVENKIERRLGLHA